MYGFRFYDPSIGRFTAIDPLAESFDFQSTFSYAANNPISNVDVMGLAAANAQDLVNDVWGKGTGTYDNNGNRIESADSASEETPCGDPPCGYDARQRAREKAILNGDDPGGKKMIAAMEAEMKGAKEVIMFYVGGKAFQLAFKGGRWVIYSYRANQALRSSKFFVHPDKFKYFFGKVKSGSSHNIARSAQNLKDLNTLGIHNKAELMKVFANVYANGKKINTLTSKYGTTIIKSINAGKKGKVEVSFFYKGGDMSSVPSVTTLIPKIFK